MCEMTLYRVCLPSQAFYNDFDNKIFVFTFDLFVGVLNPNMFLWDFA